MIVNKILNYNSSRYSDDDHNGDIKEIDKDLITLFNCLQGRVRFGENISGRFFNVSDTGSANTEFSINHNLSSIPTGYLVTSISNAGIIYKSSTSWTSSNVYLKCSSANAAVTLFLLT